MNYLLLLGPIGMILVGVIAIIYYQKTRKPEFILYSWGGLLWLVTVGAKAVMDFTITPAILDYINTTIPSLLLFLASLIVGLRTGFFESGISYLMLRNKLKKTAFNNAVTIGIGFGATEAIILGALSLSNMIMLMNPAFTASLTEAQMSLVETQLNQDSSIIFAPWLERAFTLIAHVFATVLVVKAISSKKMKYLWFSVIYKTVLDTPVPYFQLLISDGNVLMTYLVETYFIFLGLLGLYGLRRLSLMKEHSVKKKI